MHWASWNENACCLDLLKPKTHKAQLAFFLRKGWVKSEYTEDKSKGRNLEKFYVDGGSISITYTTLPACLHVCVCVCGSGSYSMQ